MPDRSVLNFTRLGWGLAVPAIFLLALGLTTIHAADLGATDSSAIADPGAGSGSVDTTASISAIGPLTLRQSLYIISGIALMLLTMLVNYQEIGRYAYA